jgi:hypothetical protein
MVQGRESRPMARHRAGLCLWRRGSTAGAAGEHCVNVSGMIIVPANLNANV